MWYSDLNDEWFLGNRISHYILSCYVYFSLAREDYAVATKAN